MPSANIHTDTSGRFLAFLVFLIGVGLLCLVFGLAWSLFRSPVPGLELPTTPGTAPPPAAGIGVALTAFVRQLLLLALMTIGGSLIAGKGIQLYYSAAYRSVSQDAALLASKNGHSGVVTTATPVDAPTKTPPG